MLNLIFSTCKPNTFEGFLKDIHKGKYDIADIIGLYRKGTNPLELVVDGCNFQNFEEIGSVFSKVIGMQFWKSVKELRVRVTDTPETEAGIADSHLKALKSTLGSWHELIHNLDFSRTSLPSQQRYDVAFTAVLALACGVACTNYLGGNSDDELCVKKLI